MEAHTIVAGRPGIFVALSDARDRPTAENAANARLIAAAPRLLEALKNIYRKWETYENDPVDADVVRDEKLWAEASAAIAKAEGRS